jgi:molybdate transport system substrate-binding protein
MSRAALAAAALAVTALSCRSEPEPITIAASSSARGALPELMRAFEEEHAVQVVPLYGPSGALAARVAGGAAIDLVLLGDGFADELARAGHVVADSRALVAENRLVLVAMRSRSPSKAGSPGAGTRFATLVQLPAAQPIAIANPSVSAAGRSTRELLERLGVWAALRPRLRLRGDSAAALADLRRGNAAAAIVVETELRTRAGTDVAVLDRADQPRPELWLALTRRGGGRAEARALASFLGSAKARAVLAAHGFRGPAGR